MSDQEVNMPAEPIADAELDDVTGGGTGSTSVIRKNGTGYSRSKIG